VGYSAAGICAYVLSKALNDGRSWIMVPEPVREHLDAALPTAADGDLVHAAGGHRPPVANPEPKLRN
jgi:hypothetical protein